MKEMQYSYSHSLAHSHSPSRARQWRGRRRRFECRSCCYCPCSPLAPSFDHMLGWMRRLLGLPMDDGLTGNATPGCVTASRRPRPGPLLQTQPDHPRRPFLPSPSTPASPPPWCVCVPSPRPTYPPSPLKI